MKKAGALVALVCTLAMALFSGCTSLKAPSTRQVMYAESVHIDVM